MCLLWILISFSLLGGAAFCCAALVQGLMVDPESVVVALNPGSAASRATVMR
jgi:hypothetical protein